MTEENAVLFDMNFIFLQALHATAKSTHVHLISLG